MNRDIKRAYRILGLPAGAPTADIKAAYRDLAQVWHPDRFSHSERLQEKAQRNLSRINEAFQALKDYDPAKDVDQESILSSTMSAVMDMGDMLQTRSINKDRFRAPQAPSRPSGPTGQPGRRRRAAVVGLEEWERTGVLKKRVRRKKLPVVVWIGVALGAIVVVVVTLIAVMPAFRRFLFGP